MIKKKRKVPESLKKKIAGQQYYKCNNKPGSNLRFLENYECPLWKYLEKECKGSFDESGYEIDHIIEYSISQNDNENNLQALCPNCHAIKTKRFNAAKMIINDNAEHSVKCKCDICLLMLEDDEFLKILNIYAHALITRHFNPETPQYHNIYIDNIKSTYVHAYTNNRWQLIETNTAMKDLVKKITNTLIDTIVQVENTCSKKEKKQIFDDINLDSVFIGLIDVRFNKIDNQKLCKYLKHVLFAKKDIVIATRKIKKNQQMQKKINNNVISHQKNQQR